VKRYLAIFVTAVAVFALGAAVQRYYDVTRLTPPQAVQTAKPAEATPPAADDRANGVAAINFDHEPLWAYGFDKPPAPGEKARPQYPPNRNLRPNEDPGEQTRLRPLQGSKATYSLVDIRDGQNVIDWFPGDHPPMPDVVAHGPVRL